MLEETKIRFIVSLFKPGQDNLFET